MRIKILHYIIRPYFYRCHYPFQDSEEIEHFYFGPSARQPPWFKKDKNHVLYDASPNKHSITILQKIAKVKPDIILLSDYSLDVKTTKALKDAGYQIWLINHGIWCPGFLDRRAKVGEKNNVNLQFIDRAFHTEPEQLYFLNLGYSEMIFKSIKGYIGLDILEYVKKFDTLSNYQTKYKISQNENEKEPTILFITNKAGFHPHSVCNDSETYKEYCKVFDNLSKWAEKNKYKLLVKMKMTRSLEMKTKKLKGHNDKHVFIIPGNELLYPALLLADIVVIQGYSTSYIEALYLNKVSIICQIPKNHDFQGLEQYPQLLVAYDFTKLNNLLDQGISLVKSVEYQKDRMKYLQTYVSLPTESLIERIEADAKKKFIKG